MNSTHCEMKFLNHEQFLTFVEKFGNEKNEIDFKYFGIKKEDLLANVTMRKLDGTFGIMDGWAIDLYVLNDLKCEKKVTGKKI